MQAKNPFALFIKESWLLLIASLVFGLLLAGVNAAWQPKIKANEKKKVTDELSKLIANSEFEQILDQEQVELGPKESTKINLYKATQDGLCSGWAFTATGPGYADKITLLIAVDASFEHIQGYGVLFSNETTGFGDKIKTAYYRDQFKNAPASKLELLKLGNDKEVDDKIIAISGATISSNAVVDIFNKHIAKVKEIMQQKGLL